MFQGVVRFGNTGNAGFTILLKTNTRDQHRTLSKNSDKSIDRFRISDTVWLVKVLTMLRRGLFLPWQGRSEEGR